MKKYLACSLLMIFNICFGAIASAQSIDEQLLNKKKTAKYYHDICFYSTR